MIPCGTFCSFITYPLLLNYRILLPADLRYLYCYTEDFAFTFPLFPLEYCHFPNIISTPCSLFPARAIASSVPTLNKFSTAVSAELFSYRFALFGGKVLQHFCSRLFYFYLTHHRLPVYKISVPTYSERLVLPVTFKLSSSILFLDC